MASDMNLQSIIPILQQNDVEFAGVFGSRARGDAREDSDLDLLIRFNKPKGFVKFIHLENELARVLGTKVDLVTERSLKSHVREHAMRDLKVLYGTQQTL